MLKFDKETLIKALTDLGEILFLSGKMAEIAVFGGSALMLMFDYRQATRDVDAVFFSDKTELNSAIITIAEKYNFDNDWINDGVKGFVNESVHDTLKIFRSFPDEDHPGLRIFLPSAEYILSMKCLAMRTEIGSSDISDIKILLKKCSIDSPEELFDLIAMFYPKAHIPPKTQFGILELFEELRSTQ